MCSWTYLGNKDLVCIYDIKQLFQKKCIRSFTNYMIIGKKLSGKTTLISNILDDLYKKHTDYIVDIFTNTTNYTQFYDGLKDDRIKLHLDYDSSIIEEYIREYDLDNTSNNKKEARIFVFDTCFNDDDMINDIYFKKLIVNSRYYNCYSIIAIENPVVLPPKIRVYIDYIFVFHSSNLKERSIIHDEYCSIIDKEHFYTVYDYLSKYVCIFIDNVDDINNYSSSRKDYRYFPYSMTTLQLHNHKKNNDEN